MSYPNSACYYISPYFKQSKEIVWANKRVQSFGKREWLLPGSQGINNTELRLNFLNGSFIKLDGSDNHDAYRGVQPSIMIYDEFAQFKPEFHIAMEPNLAVFNAPLMIIGTPPDRECQYTEMAREYQANPKKLWAQGSSWDNPHIDKEWLGSKREELIKRGEFDVWQREYLAEFVPGGVTKIFPMLSRSHVRPHDEVTRELSRDVKKLEWFVITDPAAATVFAVLFAAINPYTKKIYLLDEIYETEQSRMTVDQMCNHMFTKRDILNIRTEWRHIYDEAETWFKNEAFDRFGQYFEPTRKSSNDKEDGLSLIKDAMLQGNVIISDRCKKLFWELDNYYKDKNGKIPKSHDHLIDCTRYLLANSNYSLNTEREYIESRDENFRGAKISDDFKGLDDLGARANEDWEIELWQ
jgi:hypothetical protein